MFETLGATTRRWWTSSAGPPRTRSAPRSRWRSTGLLPNDTDFTAFLDQTVRRAELRLHRRRRRSTTRRWTPPQSMDRGSLQHHGDNALGLAREFGRTDLTRLRRRATTRPTSRCPAGWSAIRAGCDLAAGGCSPCSRWPRSAGWPAGSGRTSTGRAWPPASGWPWCRSSPPRSPPSCSGLAIIAIRPGYADAARPVPAGLVPAGGGGARRHDPARSGTRCCAAGSARPRWRSAGWAGWPCSGAARWRRCARRGVPGGAAGAGRRARRAGGAAGCKTGRVRRVLAVTAAAAVAVLLLAADDGAALPRAGDGAGRGGGALRGPARPGRAAGARPAASRRRRRSGGWSRCAPGGSASLPALAAGLATVVLAGVGLAVDRFDADHPVPTHLMYALDADDRQRALAEPGDRPAALDGPARRRLGRGRPTVSPGSAG